MTHDGKDAVVCDNPAVGRYELFVDGELAEEPFDSCVHLGILA